MTGCIEVDRFASKPPASALCNRHRNYKSRSKLRLKPGSSQASRGGSLLASGQGSHDLCDKGAGFRGCCTSISITSMGPTASLDWSKVAHLESQQLFLVKTQDGSVCEGTLSRPEEGSGRPLKIHMSEPPKLSKVRAFTEKQSKLARTVIFTQCII